MKKEKKEIQLVFYYKDDKGNYFAYKKPAKDLIEITEEEFNQHLAIIYSEIEALRQADDR